MKTFALLLLLPVVSFAQLPLDSTTNRFTYTAVIEVPGVSKLELYTRARSWFVEYYKDADAVIQMEDKESGRLIGKGRFGVIWQMGVERLIRHTVQIDVKDGRFRYSISNFMVYFSSMYKEFPLENVPSELNSGVKNLYQRTHERTLLLEQSIKKAMMSQSTASDW